MKSKFIYEVNEQSVDVRKYTIESDKPLTDRDDNCRSDIIDLICHLDITKNGDTTKAKTKDGTEAKITYVGTDYGDDSQMDWDSGVFFY